jgi:hypothetical protein
MLQAPDIKRLICIWWRDGRAEIMPNRGGIWLTFGVNTAEIG